MRIKNTELLAKIASGQILPGICKNVNINQMISHETIKTITPSENITNHPDETLKIVENRLYNKKYQNNVTIQKNERMYLEGNQIKTEDEIKNKIANFVLRSREPKSTVFFGNSLINGKPLDCLDLLKTNLTNEYQALSDSLLNYELEQNKREFSLPLPQETYAFESGTDIILKGTNIILCVNKSGLIGSSCSIPKEFETLTNSKTIGLKYMPENSSSKNNYFEYMGPLFSNKEQKQNFNCIKMIYSNSNNETKIVTNVNLYNSNTQTGKTNLPTNLPENYESLNSVNHYDVCTDGFLSTETIGKSKDLEHAISYSFGKSDNKISVNVTLTNKSNQNLSNLKYYYAGNLHVGKHIDVNQVSHFKTSPNETGIFCESKAKTYFNQPGIYLRTKESNSFMFIDNEWDWLYGDKWHKIKLTTKTPIDREDLAISGLEFNKKELKPNCSWSINFSIGFGEANEFLSQEFANQTTGLDFNGIDFTHKKLHNLITTCADFTGCNLSGADLSGNCLSGAKTGPLAPDSTSPALLPKGYKFVVSAGPEKHKYIVGPNLNLSNLNLCQIDFSAVDLSGSNLSGSDLSDSIFYGTNIIYSSVGKNLSHNNMTVQIPGYTVRGGFILGPYLNYSKQNFSNVDLSGLNLTSCTFSDCNFSGAIIGGTNFSTCKFKNVVPGPFNKQDIVHTTLPLDYKFVNLPDGMVCFAGPEVNFSNWDLSNVKLTSINLSQVNFTNTKLNNVELTGSILTDAITGPIRCETKLIHLPKNYNLVSLENQGYNFIVGPNVSLININLSGIDLSNVNLSGAKLLFSQLSKTNLSNTNLQNACLPLVIGPLANSSNKPVYFENQMSLENIDGTKWLVYKWNHYNWDIYSSQLHNIITNN